MERNRGMFGYEGEGFDFVREPRKSGSIEGDATRGWNIGSADDGGESHPSYRGRGPKNYSRSDESIREDVCERLAVDHNLDATNIEVSVSDGVVTLDGSVSDRSAKRLAEDLSDFVRGVRDVQNNIRVR
jgi:osmotically-inducible protein OsmY